MLNARTLAQAPKAADTSGADVPESPNPPGEPVRPMEAFQTKEGVIVLSNRPAGEAAAAPASARAAPAPTPAAPAPAAKPTAPARAPAPVPQGPVASDASGAALWLLLAATAIAVATLTLLLVRRKRRRTTERYAALLAGSEPIAPAPDEHVGPFSRRGSALSTRTPRPVSGARSAVSSAAATFEAPPPSAAGRTPLPVDFRNDERSSPRSAPPPSGIAPPPASERQWLSQRPPRSYKQPPS